MGERCDCEERVMAEYIEREKAFNAILNLVPKVDDDGYCWVIRGDAAKAIDSIPAADVRPVVHGHNTGNARIFECSECGYGFSDIFLTNERDYPIDPNYCPNCGARMEKS